MREQPVGEQESTPKGRLSQRGYVSLWVLYLIHIRCTYVLLKYITTVIYLFMMMRARFGPLLQWWRSQSVALLPRRQAKLVSLAVDSQKMLIPTPQSRCLPLVLASGPACGGVAAGPTVPLLGHSGPRWRLKRCPELGGYIEEFVRPLLVII
jgi:hypothetical protein